MALGLAALAMLWSPTAIGVGTSTVAAATCPTGWTAVSNASVPTVTLFCRKAFTGYDAGYFIRVPSQHVGQVTEQQGAPCVAYAGSSGNPNPQLYKRSVADWLSTWRGCGYNLGIAINGTFFNDTSSNPTSSVSFPVKAASPGYVTGSDTSVTRYCFAFGGASSTPGRAVWNIATSGWAAVGTEFTTAQPNGCATSTTYHQVVGESPSQVNTYPVYGGNIPRTYIGKASSGNEVCILVGGNFTNAVATSTFTTFGCTTPVQLDGGKSTQMSYYTTSGTISSPVTGCCLGGSNRPVPHAIVIWR